MPTEHFLYLVTRGRKTGQPRQIEIWYVEEKGRFYIVAEKRENAQWVKNLRTYADVEFSVGSRGDRASQVPRSHARARAIDDAAEPDLAARIGALMQQKYGWSDGLIVEILPSR